MRCTRRQASQPRRLVLHHLLVVAHVGADGVDGAEAHSQCPDHLVQAERVEHQHQRNANQHVGDGPAPEALGQEVERPENEGQPVELDA
jgi:hypothetical protein